MFCLMAAVLVLGSCGKKPKQWFEKDYLAVQMSKGDSWSIIDKDGKEVVVEEYPADAQISAVNDGVFWVKQGDTYHLYSIDSPKKPVTDEEFAHATDFQVGVAVVANPNQQIRIIDTKGRTVATLPKSIKRCRKFEQWGYARIKNTDNKEGIIDTKGNIVLKPEYEAADVAEGMMLTLKDKEEHKIQMLDMNGKTQGSIDSEKHPIHVISGGLVIARNSDADDAHIAAFDKAGKKVFEVKKADGRGSTDFFDGYLMFTNADGKSGIADKDGEILIRPKYERMSIIGGGRFFAKKGDKWGVVNEKDETVIDFDYDDWYFVLGDNYIMKDGSSYAIVGKDGKEIDSFHSVSAWAGEVYVDYVDIEGIANSIIKVIEDSEKGKTAAQWAKELSLDIDNFHYKSYIETKTEFDDKVTFSQTTWYSGSVAEEKTHQEQVNDGWFTYDRTVSDGWHWNTGAPTEVSGTIKINDSSISRKDLYNQLAGSLADGRTKLAEGTFTKNIKLGGKTVECRTSLTNNDGYDYIGLEILFRE